MQKFNWIDIVILLVIAKYAFDSYRAGFWIALANVLSFLASFGLGLLFYPSVAPILRNNFSILPSFSNVLAFLIIIGFAELLFPILFSEIEHVMQPKEKQSSFGKIVGGCIGTIEGLLFSSIILLLMTSFPILPRVKSEIGTSQIGSEILKQTGGFESQFKTIFGDVIDDSLTYLTIKPSSDETVSIPRLRIANLSENPDMERAMFVLVNKERRAAGLPELTYRAEVVTLARAHARDMWERGYFGHVSPDGEDVSDRMAKNDKEYLVVGENLALAPTLETAHTGLMNSPGHKANILHKDFKRMGIGIIENDIQGIMFVQVFSD